MFLVLILSIIIFTGIGLILWVLHVREKQAKRLKKRNVAIQERQAQTEQDRLLRLSGQPLQNSVKEVPSIYKQIVSKNADQQVRRDEDERRKRCEEDSTPIFPAPFFYDSGSSSSSNQSSSNDSGGYSGGDSSSSGGGGSW